MKALCSALIGTFLCLSLGACTLTLPAVASGHFSLLEPGQPVRSWQLSRAQVESLNAWLGQHRAGWIPIIGSQAATALVAVQDSRGLAWTIYVRDTTVVVSGSELVLRQSFAAHEIASLLAALGA